MGFDLAARTDAGGWDMPDRSARTRKWFVIGFAVAEALLLGAAILGARG